MTAALSPCPLGHTYVRLCKASDELSYDSVLCEVCGFNAPLKHWQSHTPPPSQEQPPQQSPVQPVAWMVEALHKDNPTCNIYKDHQEAATWASCIAGGAAVIPLIRAIPSPQLAASTPPREQPAGDGKWVRLGSTEFTEYVNSYLHVLLLKVADEEHGTGLAPDALWGSRAGKVGNDAEPDCKVADAASSDGSQPVESGVAARGSHHSAASPPSRGQPAPLPADIAAAVDECENQCINGVLRYMETPAPATIARAFTPLRTALAGYENEVLERAARVCDEQFNKHAAGRMVAYKLAARIRGMKKEG